MIRILKLIKKHHKLKASFPMNSSTVHKRGIKSEFPRYDAFFSKLRNVNLLEKDHSDYQNLLSCGLKTEEALSKMKISKSPPSGEGSYQFLLAICNKENMCTFKHFLRRYNNKNFVPTLEAMQKCQLFITRKELTC